MSTSTLSIPVPLSGFGAPVDVSAMVGPKTVILTGTFKGTYVVYGAHVGASLVPLFQFDSGGVEGIRRTISGALATVAIRSMAQDAFGVTASISGESGPGDNTFASLGILAPGSSGPQPAYDLGTSNYQSGLNFILAGGLVGKLVVEGSSDAVRWNPVGQFSVDSSGPGLLGNSLSAELSPLTTDELVRYVRLNVLGILTSTVVVTVGGSKSGGGGGAGSTLALTYQAGSGAADQTLVLEDARGGKVVFNATSATFTGAAAVEVIVPGGVGAQLLKAGGMALGPVNIVVGFPGAVPVFDATDTGNSVYIGGRISSLAPSNQYQVAVGFDLTFVDFNFSYNYGAVLVGGSSTSNGGGNVVVGLSSEGIGGEVVLVGSYSKADGYGAVVVGDYSQGTGHTVVLVGNGLIVNGYQSVSVGSSNSVLAGHCSSLGSSLFANSNFDIVVGATLNTPINGSGEQTGTFDTVADAGGGNVTIHPVSMPAGLLAGQSVNITASTGYDGGPYVIFNVTGTTFDITCAWSATSVGNFQVMSMDGCNIFVGYSFTSTSLPGQNMVRLVAIGDHIQIGIGSQLSVCIGSGAALAANTVGAVAIGQSVISKSYAVVLGVGAGSESVGVAIGSNAHANAVNTVAIGHSSAASGQFAVSVGELSHALDVRSIAVGYQAYTGIGTVEGVSSIAIGDGATANTDTVGGYATIAVGANSRGYGSRVVVIGSDATVFGTSSVVIGAGNNVGTAGASYQYEVICGYGTTVWGSDVVAIGRQHNVGVNDSHLANRTVTVGSIISVGAGASLSIAIGTDMGIGGGPAIIAIGASAGSGAGSSYGVAIGAGAIVSNNHSLAFGRESQTLADNQVVFGQSAGSSPGAWAIHEFVVRGYNGAAVNTIDVIDNPTDSGNPNLGVTGLTVVYIQNSAVSNKTLKAALLANLPPGALVTYF